MFSCEWLSEFTRSKCPFIASESFLNEGESIAAVHAVLPFLAEDTAQSSAREAVRPSRLPVPGPSGSVCACPWVLPPGRVGGSVLRGRPGEPTSCGSISSAD